MKYFDAEFFNDSKVSTDYFFIYILYMKLYVNVVV